MTERKADQKWFSNQTAEPTRVGIAECRLLDLPRREDPRGTLTFIETMKDVPFDVKRVFYIYDIPTDASRGAHAHLALHQFCICLSGGFYVELDDGAEKNRVHLHKPWQGLYIPPMIWAAEVDFYPGSICLVLASALYDENDYVRDYDRFLALAKENRRS